MLWPVRALRCYERTAGFRVSDRLFLCFGARGLSSQRLAHWIHGGIGAAYEARSCPPPAVVRAHSTWGISTLVTLCHTQYDPASWSSMSTFVLSYHMDMSAGSDTLSVLKGSHVVA